jgi:pSer/pThr/pTyr-binding forkhead associated (FHA) protein
MSQPAVSKTPGFVLLLSTERQVHAFDLSKSSSATIGRHKSNDLQLVSRNVSNYHAEIVLDDEGLLMRDLGSTNGSYLNGELVNEGRLKNGDLVRIGNHQMTVQLERLDVQKDGSVRFRRDPMSFVVGTKGNIVTSRATSDRALATSENNDPHDLPLPDLLKILTTNADSVLLQLRRGGETGKIFIKKNTILHAEDGRVSGEKAFCRLFGWHNAEYELLEYPTTFDVAPTIQLPADTLILEGMSQISELSKLIAELPPLEVALALNDSCTVPVSAHSAAEIEIYLSLIRHQTIAAVLEATPLTDCRALRLIRALIKKNVFTTSNTSDYSPDETFSFVPKDNADPF